MPLTPLFTIDPSSPFDDEVVELPIPFDFFYNGVNYGNGANGGIWWCSNNHIIFGFGQSFTYQYWVPSASSVLYENINGEWTETAIQYKSSFASATVGNYVRDNDYIYKIEVGNVPVIQRILVQIAPPPTSFDPPVSGSSWSYGFIDSPAVVSIWNAVLLDTTDCVMFGISGGEEDGNYKINIQGTSFYPDDWGNLPPPNRAFDVVFKPDSTIQVITNDFPLADGGTSGFIKNGELIAASTISPFSIVTISGFNTSTEANSGGGGTPPVDVAVKKNFLTNAGNISAAALAIFNFISETAASAGFTVTPLTKILTDGTEAFCLDIKCNKGKYFVTLPTDPANTRLPTLGSYIGANLDTSPSQTYCNYDDLDKTMWDFNNDFLGNPTVTIFASSQNNTLWWIISYGDLVSTVACTVSLPRTDSLFEIESYPKYGVYYNGGITVAYSNRIVNEWGVVTDYKNMAMGLSINSLINPSTLGEFELVGGIQNAVSAFSYPFTPIINPYMTIEMGADLYEEYNTPVLFSPIPQMRGVFIGDNYPNFSTYIYGGKQYSIIKNDVMRISYVSPWQAHTVSLITPATGFSQLPDWSV